MRLQLILPVAACLLLAACETGVTPQTQPFDSTRLAPPGAPPGTCWENLPTPAVVETVSEQVLVRPAKINPDGTIAKLPVYRSEDRQKIVTPRQDRWFETPCPPSFTVEFVSSLQRALAARGHYAGPVNGLMDVPTRNAVRRLQAAEGLDSDRLSIKTARMLGLVIT